ncbi:hypothetical protein FOTG_08021 [Fusarium oxysporum f. sp. vasinfectum 25433]|uniref:Uncharacterized protein n=1 Tax=Fusarium oxysporum f. sp. vasinfectum 25433 TaxID=1089449 RepID=X0LGE9_FUSOX|nr:hypothetical protein FOTG_08021 [Fusarium oxysporum f. sp. vasinfectum 25433]
MPQQVEKTRFQNKVENPQSPPHETGQEQDPRV